MISDNVYRHDGLERGYPEPVVDILISMFEATREGELNVVYPTLERILGRRRTELKEVLQLFLANGNSPVWQ